VKRVFVSGLIALGLLSAGCKAKTDASASARQAKTSAKASANSPAAGDAKGKPKPRKRTKRRKKTAPPCGAGIRRTQADAATVQKRSPARGWTTVMGCAQSSWRGWTLDEAQTQKARTQTNKPELCCYVTPPPVEPSRSKSVAGL
jgi:hypothetical protein